MSLFHQYEKLVKGYPALNKQQEIALATKAASGNRQACEKLFKHNAARILMFARKLSYETSRLKDMFDYQHGLFNRDEAICIIAEALYHAIKKFDPSRDSKTVKDKVRFSSWANFIIRQRAYSAAKKERKYQDRRESFPPWSQEVIPSHHRYRRLITPDQDYTLGRERFWEIFSQLSERDQETILHERVQYKKAIERLKALTTTKEWEALRKIITESVSDHA